MLRICCRCVSERVLSFPFCWGWFIAYCVNLLCFFNKTWMVWIFQKCDEFCDFEQFSRIIKLWEKWLGKSTFRERVFFRRLLWAKKDMDTWFFLLFVCYFFIATILSLSFSFSHSFCIICAQLYRKVPIEYNLSNFFFLLMHCLYFSNRSNISILVHYIACLWIMLKSINEYFSPSLSLSPFPSCSYPSSPSDFLVSDFVGLLSK